MTKRYVNRRHLEPARIVGEPEPGWFRVQLAKKGRWYGAKVTHAPTEDPLTGEALDRPWYWRTEIDGDVIGEPSPDPVLAGVFQVWEHGTTITEEEYHRLIAESKAERRSADFSELEIG